MLFVVDSNVLFTSFWRTSTFNDIIKEKRLTLLAPNYAVTEIQKHKEEIRTKARLSQQEFENSLQQLQESVTFIQEREYQHKYQEVKAAISNLKKEEQEEILLDIDFLALAIAKNCPLWSNDKALKKQKRVTALTTEETIKLLA